MIALLLIVIIGGGGAAAAFLMSRGGGGGDTSARQPEGKASAEDAVAAMFGALRAGDGATVATLYLPLDTFRRHVDCPDDVWASYEATDASLAADANKTAAVWQEILLDYSIKDARGVAEYSEGKEFQGCRVTSWFSTQEVFLEIRYQTLDGDTDVYEASVLLARLGDAWFATDIPRLPRAYANRAKAARPPDEAATPPVDAAAEAAPEDAGADTAADELVAPDEPADDTAPDPALADLESTGLPACDEYLAAVAELVMCEAVPQATRDATLKEVEQFRSAWADLDDMPAVLRTSIEDGCRKAATALEESLAASGC